MTSASLCEASVLELELAEEQEQEQEQVQVQVQVQVPAHVHVPVPVPVPVPVQSWHQCHTQAAEVTKARGCRLPAVQAAASTQGLCAPLLAEVGSRSASL